MLEAILKTLEDKYPRMVAIRRYLHQYPELSFEEVETARYIADFYQDLACQVETNVGGHGVKVTIDSGRPGRTLAIRADFDGLPIQEETGLAFASKNPGLMHACGHDGHTAYLLILAETLIEFKDQLSGRIIIIHQPAEEQPPGGALPMIQEGVLEGVDHVLGLHLMSQMPFGQVNYGLEEIQTGRSYFKIKVQGQGGHGSSPHEANDAIVAASHFVVASQTIVSRRLNPFDMGVVTIGSFDGAGTFNVIKDSVVLEGDVRAMTDQTLATIEEEIQSICRGLEAMFGVTCQVDYQHQYPALYNDPDFTLANMQAIEEAHLDLVESVNDIGAIPPSEDFAYFAKERPSTYFFIGAQVADGIAYPHHHPKFDFNEQAMLVAAQAMACLVVNYISHQ
ncbi:amidohydrolase [Hutsoniella sourekii]